MENQSYTWTDNPTVSGVSPCNTDVLNECLMHLKYNQDKGDGFSLFDIKITDRKLVGEEAVGWVIQGGLVTMTYPDAVNKITEEFNEGATTTYRGISCVQSLTGHYIADIAQKDAIDKLFAQTGIAEFYILDKTNQQFYLPRNKWFMQLTTDDTKLNQFNEAGLPNITSWVQGAPWKSVAAGGAMYVNGEWNTDHGSGADGYHKTRIDFNASRSSSIYGKSSTVQPLSGNKLLYYKVGNVTTGVGQILIDAQEFLSESAQQLENTAEEGLSSIESAVDDGVSAISNVSSALKQTQISNCILETFQNIYADCQSTGLTLRKGSIFIVPYGTSAPTMEVGDTLNGGTIVDVDWDGEKLFYYVKLDADITLTTSGTGTLPFYLYVSPEGTVLGETLPDCYAQDTAPVDISESVIWYDTTNNYVKVTLDTGSSWTQGHSLGLCVVNRTTGGVISELNQLLSPITYCANVLFLSKGTKLLFPDGRNADGTCKNIEVTTQKTILRLLDDLSATETNAGLFAVYNDDGNIEISIQSSQTWNFGNRLSTPVYIKFYVTPENQWYEQTGSNTQIYNKNYLVHIGTASRTNGKVTFLENRPFKTFAALDMNNTAYISKQSMPGRTYALLSVQSSGKLYTAPADGYVLAQAKSTTAGGFIDLQCASTCRTIAVSPSSGSGLAATLPVRKAASFSISYTNISDLNIIFTYTNGAQ